MQNSFQYYDANELLLLSRRSVILASPDRSLAYRYQCPVETRPSSKSVKPPVSVSGTMNNFTIILIVAAVAFFALFIYDRVRARLANPPPTPPTLEVGPGNPTWPRYETPFGTPGADFGAPGGDFGAPGGEFEAPGASGTTLQGHYKATELPTYEQAMTIKDTKSTNVYESTNVYGVV